ncbi:MAG TPA: formyltransferase family protein [Bryobacteraceae bacterium]|nr:formyltransferase family protein [Bryobacteraceae bacterium]
MPEPRQPRSLRVLLVGEESAGVQTLNAVARTVHEVVAVMTSARPAAPTASLSAVAARLGIPVWSAALVQDKEFAEEIRAAGVDLILNVHSLHLICNEVIRAARIGAFNMHPGPLPEYAGLNTVSWGIYNGETTFGVTVHWLAPKIDAGDIAYESTFTIEEADTPLRVMHNCVSRGIPLILQLLETAALDPAAIPREPQDLSRRRYFGRQPPEQGRLSWRRKASEIVNFIRACNYAPYDSPWGHPITMSCHRQIAIIDAARTERPSTTAPGTIRACDEPGVLVSAIDEWVSVRQVEVDGWRGDPKSVLKAGDVLTETPRARVRYGC